MISAVVFTYAALSILLGLLALFGVVLSTNNVDQMQAPSGPLRSAAIRVVQGQVTLVAGAATEALTTAVLPAGVPVYSSRRVAGGTPGNITCANDGAGNVVFSNTSATDTSSVSYFFFVFS